MSSFDSLGFREGFAGGCYVNGTETCVAEPEDFCDEGTFVSAHWVRANSGHPLRYCAGELENVAIGRCGDSGKCSNLPSRCEDNSTFVAFDPTCTVTQDLSRDGAYVTYGRCGDRCVWSPEDCFEGETYVKDDLECTAEKVQIGACFAGHAFCAVGQKSCTHPGLPDEPFWTHEKVQDVIGANCFLSSLPAPPTPPSPPPTRAPRTASPVASPTSEQVNDNSMAGILERNGSSNGSLPTGAVVTIVAVIAVVLGIGVGISTVHCKRNDKEAWRVEKQPALPVEDFETSHQIEIADSENISDI